MSCSVHCQCTYSAPVIDPAEARMLTGDPERHKSLLMEEVWGLIATWTTEDIHKIRPMDDGRVVITDEYGIEWELSLRAVNPDLLLNEELSR